MRKDLIKKIIPLIILSPLCYYIYKSLIQIPFISYNIYEIITCFFINLVLLALLVNAYSMLYKGKLFNKLLFMIATLIFIFLSIISTDLYGKFSLQSLYGISNTFSDKTYENKILSNIEGNLTYFTSDIPSEVRSLTIYFKDDLDYEVSFDIIVCTKHSCINDSSVTSIGDSLKTIKIPNGYNLKNLTINSNTGSSWIERIEYNNKSVLESVKINRSLALKSATILLVFIIMIIILEKIINKYRIIDNLKKQKTYNTFRKKLKIENIFLVVGIVIGLIYSFVIPTYNVPDENTHIKYIYNEIGLDHVYEQIADNYDCDDCIDTVLTTSIKVNFKNYYKASKKKLNDYSFKNFKLDYHVISHLPQAIGLILGQLLHLPIFWILELGEIFAILFYSIAGFLILKLLPIKKNIMFFIMLLPMAIQQYSSLSYDAMLNVVCFLLFAKILQIKFGNELLTIKNILFFLGLLLVIYIIKLPYVLIGALILTIPFNKYQIKFCNKQIDISKIFKNKIFITILSILIISAALFILPQIEFGKMIISAMLEPNRMFLILKNTFMTYHSFYLTSAIANFGWLNTQVSSYFIYFVVAFCLFICFYHSGKKKEIEIPVRTKIFSIVIFMMIAFFIVIAMLFAWTIPGEGIVGIETLNDYRNAINMISRIEGVQGRYFIPILPLILFLPTRNSFKSSKNTYHIIELGFYIISFIYCVSILLFRFWL